MLGRLILLFILLPLADLFLLLLLSEYTGWKFSVAMVIASGLIGAYLARRSSRVVWNKLQSKLGQGVFSAELLSDGAMILFAAGLMLTPGFITDAIGFSILFSPIRNWYKTRIAKWFNIQTNFEILTPQVGPDRQPPLDDNTVEGQVADGNEE